MSKLRQTLPILILTVLLTACAGNAAAQAGESAPVSAPEVISADPPANCPVTVPQEPAFVPPAPYDSLGFEGEFWFGSNALWAALPQDGVWVDLPLNPDGYTQKIFWWRDGYVWNEEPEPNLVVTGERLDAAAQPLNISKATNAYAADIGYAMLVGVDFPTLGCWKITGKYNDETELSFVIWVAP